MLIPVIVNGFKMVKYFDVFCLFYKRVTQLTEGDIFFSNCLFYLPGGRYVASCGIVFLRFYRFILTIIFN